MLRRTTLLLTALGTMTGAAQATVTAYDDDGMVTVNGKRTFVLGSYHIGSNFDAERPRSESLAEMAEAGFNLVHTGLDRAQLDEAQAAGLLTWVTIGTLDLEKRDETAAALVEKVNGVKDHPALAIIESVDEPAWEYGKVGPRIPADPFVEAYPIVKQADPHHLMYMNHAPTNLVKTMRAYNGGTDIVAMDIYPVNPGGLKPMYALFEDGHQGDLNNMTISQVGDYVDKMRLVTGPNRPLFMVLQGFAWEMLRKEEERDESKVLYPTAHQTRFMAYQSVIKGANGILYWGTRYTPQPSACWDGVKAVVRELADLAGPLAERAEPLTLDLDYHEMGRSVDDGVQTLAKYHDGKLYLFTCNADKNPCKATVSGLAEWKSLSVLNEDRDAPALADGAFTDTWNPHDVHVYVLAK